MLRLTEGGCEYEVPEIVCRYFEARIAARDRVIEAWELYGLDSQSHLAGCLSCEAQLHKARRLRAELEGK